MKHVKLWRLASLMAMTVLFSVSASEVGAANTNLTQPPPRQSPLSTNLPASFSPFGVQLLTAATDPSFLPTLAKAKALGVQWVRVYLSWSIIQPEAPTSPGCGNCNWSYPDTLFNALAAQGLSPIVTIAGNPGWAATSPSGPIDPAHLTDFGNFVTALVKSYPNVQYWEFDNEPDSYHRWGGHGDQYGKMLKTAYDAIHPGGAGGNQYVVFGGVAYEPSNKNFDKNFIGQVLSNANGSPLFDVMAFHYYDAFANNYSPANVIGKALKLKKTFSFLKNKPFLVTELGKQYGIGTNRKFSHELSAQQVVEMFSNIMAAPAYKVNILAGTWFSLEHYAEPTGGAPRLWGLFDTTGTPWVLEGAAYTTTANELNNASYLNRITAGGVTGYNFKLADGTIHAVLWANSGSRKVAFKTTSLTWLDKQGNATTVVDKGKGDGDKTKNGLIQLAVPASPIFVEYK